MARKDIKVRDIDRDLWREVRARAIRNGRTTGAEVELMVRLAIALEKQEAEPAPVDLEPAPWERWPYGG